jgi:hypothetical protein
MQRASTGDVYVCITVAQRGATSTRRRQRGGVHGTEVARRAAKLPGPHVDLLQQPRQAVQSHPAIDAEGDRRLAIAGRVLM